MSKCLDQDFPCQDPDYLDFDQIASVELRSPPTVHEIINESAFCTSLPVDEAVQLGDLTYKDFLRGLKGRTGIYHLWLDYDECDDHGMHTMLCVYVGKGLAEARITSHIKTTWPRSQQLYVSFFECSNRLAKYLEQLFLDTYEFHLNKIENRGEKHLFGVWDYERHLLGTELHAVCGLFSDSE